MQSDFEGYETRTKDITWCEKCQEVLGDCKHQKTVIGSMEFHKEKEEVFDVQEGEVWKA